jgi:hypothetical protein
VTERLPASEVAKAVGVPVEWVKAHADPRRTISADGDQRRFTPGEPEHLSWLAERDRRRAGEPA